MKTALASHPDYELWVLMHQTCDAIIRARENELRQKIGISRMQRAVLFIVKTTKVPATPAEISRWLFREPHSVSGLLNRMEKQGLVRKVKDLDRKNLIRIAITEKGEEAYQQSEDLKAIPNILSCLTRKKKENLKAYLEALRTKALAEIGVRRPLPFP
jgi:DNA-binding MarR family transcriptional regulator